MDNLVPTGLPRRKLGFGITRNFLHCAVDKHSDEVKVAPKRYTFEVLNECSVFLLTFAKSFFSETPLLNFGFERTVDTSQFGSTFHY